MGRVTAARGPVAGGVGGDGRALGGVRRGAQSAVGRLAAATCLTLASGCGDAGGSGAGAPAPETRPWAGFVGDAACADCHAEVVEQHHGTNHFRSLVRFEAATAPERFDVPTTVYNAATDLHYEVRLEGDTLVQREYRLDGDGRIVHDLAFPAAYVIGSGNATRSYFMDVNGYLSEMPVTWYVERERWDMSPGYEEANDRFARKINLECMTCHNGTAERAPYTQNLYPSVPLGITCERCHGPAAGHVAARTEGHDPGAGAPDTTVVNPARLDRDRQLSLCQQCHLAGVMVFREGHDPTTFRAGMALAEHRTVFVPEEQLTDPDWVGIDSHPLRLARSACYQQSGMTCSSCHAPHVPDQDLPPDHYNRRCLACHGAAAAETREHLCTRPDARGPGEAVTGDCVSCHMQQGGTSDVPHVTFTDHWIRRRPGPARDPDEGRPAFDTPDPIPLVALQEPGRPAWDLSARASSSPLHDLEGAAAYFHFWETMHRHPSYLPLVIVLARRGLAGGAEHIEARVALGRALAERDSLAAAERALRDAVARHPGDAWAHFFLGGVLEGRGDMRGATDAFRRAVEIQPAFVEARGKLADALFAAGRREEALAELLRLLEIDPVHAPRAWHNVGILRLEAGELEAARDALRRASALDPDLLDTHVQAGAVALELGRTEEAEAALRKALAADPDHVPALGSLALVELRAGRPQRARAYLERVLELDPENEAARGLLREIP